MIKNVRKSSIAITFIGKFANMRKEQDFVIYPVGVGAEYISIQSDGRWGRLYKDGRLEITSKNQNYPNSASFGVELISNKILKDIVSSDEMKMIRDVLNNTTLGNSVCSVEGNDGARTF